MSLLNFASLILSFLNFDILNMQFGNAHGKTLSHDCFKINLRVSLDTSCERVDSFLKTKNIKVGGVSWWTFKS